MTEPAPLPFGGSAAINIFAGPEERAASRPVPALGQISFERSTTLDRDLNRRLALRIVGLDGVLRGLSINTVTEVGAELNVTLNENFSEFQREQLIDRIATQLDIPRDKVRVVRATPGSVNATVLILPPEEQGAQQLLPVVTLAGIAATTTDAKQVRFDTLVRDINDKLAAGELDLGAPILGEPAVLTGIANTPAPLVVERWLAGSCGADAAEDVPLLQAAPRTLAAADALAPVAWGGAGVVGGEAITGLTDILARVDDVAYAPELGQGGAGALVAVGAASLATRTALAALSLTPPCVAFSTDLGNSWRSPGPLLLSGAARSVAYSPAQRRVLVVGEGALGGLASSVLESTDLRTWNVVSAADAPENALAVDASLPDEETGEARVQWIVGGEAADPARRIRQCTDANATEWTALAYPADTFARATAVIHAPDRIRAQDDRLPRWVVVGDGPSGFLCGPAGAAVATSLGAGTHGYDISLALTSVDYGADASGALVFVACGYGESSDPLTHPSPCAIFTSADGETWAGVAGSAALFPAGARPQRVAFGASDGAWAVLAPGDAPAFAHTLATSTDGARTWTARQVGGEGEGGAYAAAPLAPLLRSLELNAQPAGADLANFASAAPAAASGALATDLGAGDKRAAVWTGAAAALEPEQGATLAVREAGRVEVWRSEDAGALWAPAALATALPPRRMSGAAAIHWPASPLGTRLVVAGGQDAARGADAGAGQIFGVALADVWASDDGGENWSLLAAAAPWGPRRGHALVGISGDLVLLGGQRASTGDVLADVWGSSDGGTTWTLRAASAPWSPRFGHAAAAPFYASSATPIVYVLGGCDATGTPLPAATAGAWRSLDGGSTWTLRSAAPAYGARAHLAAVTLPNGAVAVVGGEDATGQVLGDQWISPDGGATWLSTLASPLDGLPPPRRSAALAVAVRTEPTTRTEVPELYLLGGEARSDLWRAQIAGSELFWTRLAEDAGTGPRLGAAMLVLPTPDCGCPDKLRVVGGELPTYDRFLLRSDDGGATWREQGGGAGGSETPLGPRLAAVPAASPAREQLRSRTRALASAPNRLVLAVGDRGAATLAPPPHLDPTGSAAWIQAGDPDLAPLAGKRLVAALHIPPDSARFVAVATAATLLDLEEEGPLSAALAAGPPAAPAFGAGASLLRADILAGSDPAQLGPWTTADLVLDAPFADTVRWRSVAYSPQLGRLVAVGWGGAGGGNARVLWSDDRGGTWSGAGVDGVPDATWWSVAWSAERGRFVAVGPGVLPRVRRLIRQGATAFDTPALNPPGRSARVMFSADGKTWTQPDAAATRPAAHLASALWSPREGVFLALTTAATRGRQRALISTDGERWLRSVREGAVAAGRIVSSTTTTTTSTERATALAYAPGPRAMCLLGRRSPLRSGRALTADSIVVSSGPLYAWEVPADPIDPAAPLPVLTLGFEPDASAAAYFAERVRLGLEFRGAVGSPTPLTGPGLLVAAPSPLHDAVIDPLLPAPLPDLRLYLGTQDPDPAAIVVDVSGNRPIAQALGWPQRILGVRFLADAAQVALYAGGGNSGQVDYARPAAAGVVDAFPTQLTPPENPFPFIVAWDTTRFDLSLSECFVDVAMAENSLLYQDALARRSRDAWVGLGAEPAGVVRYRVLDLSNTPLAALFADPPPSTLDLFLGFPPPRSGSVELTHTTGAWAADISAAPLDVPGAQIFQQRLAEDAEPAPPAYPRRSAHAAYALGGGNHVLVGGLGLSALLDDVWASADGGASWAQVAVADPKPEPRAHAAHALWRGASGTGAAECILAGGVGHGLERLDDVWASSDGGATWTLRSAAAPWGPRRAAAMVALAPDFAGAPAPAPAELVLVGGELLGTDASGNPAPRYADDVWVSSDGGATWTTRATNCPWGPRAEFALAALPAHATSLAQPAPALVLTGGMRQGGGRQRDTWVSLDRGLTWTRQPDPPPGAASWSERRGHALAATQDVSGSLLLLAGGEGRPATRSATLTCPFCDLWASRDLGATWFNVPNFGSTWSARYHHRMILDETSGDAALLLTGGFLAITLFAVDTYFSRAIAGERGWDPYLLGLRLRFSNADAAKLVTGLTGAQDLQAMVGGSQELRIVRVPEEP